jgi:hypothetical protein
MADIAVTVEHNEGHHPQISWHYDEDYDILEEFDDHDDPYFVP